MLLGIELFQNKYYLHQCTLNVISNHFTLLVNRKKMYKKWPDSSQSATDCIVIQTWNTEKSVVELAYFK